MNQRRLVCASGLLLFACGGEPPTTAAVERHFSVGVGGGEPNHEAIVADALPFLRPEIVAALQAADVSVDGEFALVNANHFDDCNFSGGADVIRALQATAVAQLDPATPIGEADARAIFAFGQSLHTVQDLYSHANWVESGGDTILEASTDAWPTWQPYTLLPAGVVLIQGEPAKHATLRRNADKPYPESAVVRVKTRSAEVLGLMTGTVDYEPGDLCPARVAMTHDQLNKDASTTPGRAAQHEMARALATQQTAHEWCRLLAMTRAAYGAAGEARLLTWAADATAATAACD